MRKSTHTLTTPSQTCCKIKTKISLSNKLNGNKIYNFLKFKLIIFFDRISKLVIENKYIKVFLINRSLKTKSIDSFPYLRHNLQ